MRDVAEDERRAESARKREDESELFHEALMVSRLRQGSGEAGCGTTIKGVVEKTAAPFVPETTSLKVLSAAAHACRGCDLYKTATQVVFGAGPRTARVMFVGEQPGDQEDLRGEPFVGPAGAVLQKALEEAGIPRGTAYLTNAVKHFKWEPRGKRRIHKKPRASEIKACRPWLEAELFAVKPVVVVCLGATAAQAVLGPQFKLMQQRGQVLPPSLGSGEAGSHMRVVATIHPSAVLRAPDSEGRRAAYDTLVSDLKVAAKVAKGVRR
jgi:DNA polymerase